MKLKKPSFWDLPNPNFFSYLLIPFSLPIILRNFLFQFLKKKKSSNIKTICVGNIYLVNSFGKTKSFYSEVKIVFLGGSLINHGGQNPLEAVRYNCNILHGPNVSNFNEIYKFLHKQKISKKVINLNQTTNILNKHFNSKKSKKNIKDKINKIGQKILKKTINEINLILNKI